MGALAFASPLVLIALIALPAIWWLLKLTPPRPKREVFPPLAILLRLGKRDETPAKSPWWLTLLRMVLAALVIFAIANPVLNPEYTEIAQDKPLALLIDNDWASAEDWQERVRYAETLIDEADAADQPVILAFSADGNHATTPISAAEARQRLAAATPHPLKPDRLRAAQAMTETFAETPPGTIALVVDGLATADDDTAFEMLGAAEADSLLVAQGRTAPPVAINRADNDIDATRIFATRADTALAETVTVNAYDTQGRAIAGAPLTFAAGSNEASAEITAPFEVRNDFARIAIDASANAGAVHLLDDGFRRRRVAIVSGAPLNDAQPLLTATYYLDQALSPYTDLISSDAETLPEEISDLLDQSPSVLILSDVGTMSGDVQSQIENWVNNGGTLIRFAGPRLAGASEDDSLLPVRLRSGARAFGGAMSWSTPQSLAPFPASSPFYGLQAPGDITVKRQVLAEPSATLADHTWASLTDGTPLVTNAQMGDGQLVLFHTSADANWSNLPISGYFVEMLRRIINLSHATSPSDQQTGGTTLLPPYRLLNAHGALTADTTGAKPLAGNSNQDDIASSEHPPGLYGTSDGFRALNLFGRDDRLMPLDPAPLGNALRLETIGQSAAFSLKPYLLLAAVILLVIDGIIILVMNGGLSRFRPNRHALPVVLLGAVIALPVFFSAAPPASAQMSDTEIADLLYETHLAYVRTGESEVDRISERGLKGLGDFIAYRSALEPGDPIGIDPATDEMAFYPLIYWPVSASAPMPSAEAIANIETYMRNGGTVLFDTRDQFSPLGSGSVSPNTQRLRAILSNIDVPPLEPVPEGHVLTRSFYLLDDFPGRYDGSPLWVEARSDNSDAATLEMTGGDGVSPIIITGNDFAGAWAINADSTPMLPTVPENPRQRILAYRSGVNIVMYMLTGNYKADQVHIPALLERLGQ